MKFKLLMLLSVVLLQFNVHAQSNTRVKQYNLSKNNLAIQGYDPIAYFTQNKAVKGNKDYAVNADGIIYYLSSVENKQLFLKDFKKYEPQYGGWCAYAMGATHEKVDVDPETFKIKDGKLFLYYNSWGNNTLKKWDKDETNLYQQADKNWTSIFK